MEDIEKGIIEKECNGENNELEEARLGSTESLDKYKELFNSIDEGFFIIDIIFDENNHPVDMFYVEANNAAKEMLGQDYTGKYLSKINPNFEDYWFEIFGSVAQTGKSQRLERYSKPNDMWFDFYVFKIGKDNDCRIGNIFKNITKLKRRENNFTFLAEIARDFARSSSPEEIMQIIGEKVGNYLNISNCLFAEIDEVQDKAIVEYAWSNEEMPNLAGEYKLSAFVTEEFYQTARNGEPIVIYNTQTDPRIDSEGHAALNIHAYVSIPFHFNGTWKYQYTVNDSTPRNWREDEINLVYEITNLTFLRLKRAQTELKLKQTEEKYHTLFDNMVEALFLGEIICDESGKPIDYVHLDANPAFHRVMGLKREEVVGKTRGEIMDTESPWLEKFANTAFTGKPIEFEGFCEDIKQHFLIKVFSLKYGQFAGIFSNITKMKQDEEKIKTQQKIILEIEKQKNKVLEETIKIKDEFLYLITHEFRTPMAVVNSAVQAIGLLYKDEVTRNIAKYLKIINQNNNRQLRLVNNLLDITKINSGNIKLNLNSFDIVHVTKLIINSVEAYATQKGVNISFQSSISKKEILLDDEKYERILLNLLANSVKFTPKDKNIYVSVTIKEDKKNMVCISVEDEGIGIPKDKHETVFERFGQANTSLSRQAEGTGLGLHLVKLLVKALHGEIILESEEGKGTAFHVFLPIVSKESLDEITTTSKDNFLIKDTDDRLVKSVAIEFSDIYL